MQEIEFNKLKKKINQRANSTNSLKVSLVVQRILQDIRLKGDEALIKYVKKFENTNAKISSLVVSKNQLKQAYNLISKEQKKSLNLAYKRIFDYHKNQIKKNQILQDELDTSFLIKWNAIENVGLYIPGGLASYPSTVLMTSIPAKIAGVKNIMVTIPSAQGVISDLTLAAAYLCKVDKVFNMGGAQAIAAFAYGTKTIPKADKVFGPGNQYVAEAKKQVFGVIGVDLPAGPSEVLVLADSSSNPQWIAADILAQAEHDPNAKTYLVSNSKNVIKNTINQLNIFQKSYKFKNVSKSLKTSSFAILAKNLSKMIEISNYLAPEHLHIHLKNTTNIENKITNAGSVFIGANNSVALGDYTIGTNHVLPTDQSAKFSSGLSVDDFMKKTVFVKTGQKTLNKIAKSTIELAKSEGLDAHALSIEIRSSKT